VVVAAAFLVKSLPALSPENLFTRTESRLQIPTDVLFNRVAALRPDNRLTRSDEVLRTKFVNLESRLLYLQYGPDALANCPFCASDDPRTYLWYAVPAIVAPHRITQIEIARIGCSANDSAGDCARCSTQGRISSRRANHSAACSPNQGSAGSAIAGV
jgi:hypothetical protein